MRTRLALAALPLLVLPLTACGGSSAADESANQDDAKRVCHDWTKDQLKSPSTAKFSGDNVSGTGGDYTITGNVDSENGFGAMIRSTWTCTVTSQGDQWHGHSVLHDGDDADPTETPSS